MVKLTQNKTRLILVGAGHTHALFLQSLVQAQSVQNPILNIEILLISPLSLAPYSGMIPGWLAGQYDFNETVIDFDALCKRVGAKWVKAEMLGLDPDAQTVSLSTGESFFYDWLSINIGSTLRPPEDLAPSVLALRPLWTLRQRYDAYLESWALEQNKKPLTITTVGAGAAGVESLLCILQRLRQMRPDRAVQARLISRSEDILPGFSATARRLARQALNNAQVTIKCDADWQNTIAVNRDTVSRDGLSANVSSSNQSSQELVIWATGAQAHDWQLDPTLRLTLRVSADGFIQVDETLRSVSHPNIFATGDCAELPSRVPKAGVYAVRMASTLIANLRMAMANQSHLTQQVQTFERFETKPYALALLNTGDGHAIASWRSFGFSGKSVWLLKDRIDRRFINKFKSFS